MRGKWGVRSVLALVVLALAVGAGVSFRWWVRAGDGSKVVSPSPSDSLSRQADKPTSESESPVVQVAEVSAEDEVKPEDPNDEAAEEPQTEEERLEAEEEAKVDAFDNLTDKWMEPSEKGVTMAEVDNFAKQFRQIPKARRDECVHRALNLIPDENVMLLAGILMDKTMDKEIVETVYNDILNRDEDVKKPILQQIFKDKSHPCWADTAWILDVTGELPKKN